MSDIDAITANSPIPEGMKAAIGATAKAQKTQDDAEKAGAAQESTALQTATDERAGLDQEAAKPGGAMAPFVDKLYKPPPSTDPWEMFGSTTMWLAGLSGMAGRRSFTRSLNAAAGYMDATHRKSAAALGQGPLRRRRARGQDHRPVGV